jgi:hypothetical protein
MILDARVRAAWQTQLAAAVKTPGLLRELIQRRADLLPRFAAQYQQLRALPRRARRALQRRLGYSLAGMALLLTLGQGQSSAATINVTTNVPDIKADGRCSLVEAIVNANNDAATHPDCTAGNGADTIVLQPGSVHTLTNINNTFSGPIGLPVLTSEITIEGNGSTIERASSAPNFRLLAVQFPGNSTQRTYLKDVTLRGGVAGNPHSPAVGDQGGGILNFGVLTIENSTISGNTAAFTGGGVSSGNTLTIKNSTLSDNSAYVRGGGIFNSGFLDVESSTLSGNTATLSGGGIAHVGSRRQGGRLLTLENSTLSGNTALRGGGIENYQSTVTIENSTLSGNIATASGGGIYTYGESFGIVTIVRSLISGNLAPSRSEIHFGGGRLYVNNFNIFGANGTVGGGFSPGATDIVPTVPLSDILDPMLADNGGPTLTHALVTGSPAIDASPVDSHCPAADQRNVCRPQGAACDIGSFEYQGPLDSGCNIALTPAKVWVGLKNSDDQGTQFDLRAELYRQDTLMAVGEVLCVTGITSNPTKAKEVVIPFGPPGNVTLDRTDLLSLRVLTRVGTTEGGKKCSGPGGSHNSAVGLKLYYDAILRASGFGVEINSISLMNYFAHTGSEDFLDATAPTASVAKSKASTGINFANGNPWKEIGRWSMIINATNP